MNIFKTKDGNSNLYCEANADEFQLLVKEVERLREEVNDKKSFTEQLEHYTQLAFDNEESFIAKVHAKENRYCSLYFFYMSGSKCTYKLERGCATKISERLSVDTSKFIEWADGLTIDSKVVDKNESH